ncbi:MAG: hypothetical protein KAF91_31120 [Nostoc sp. TH1S01]|nr:hypothetical protein [Nostoc sp. TH1S01]
MTGNKGVFRNVNILREFNAGSTTEIIDIYQPGWLNAYDIVTTAKYSGFITSLRLTIDISSIPELQPVPTDALADDTTINNAATETFNGNGKKCLSFYIRTSDTPIIKVADIYLFNQRPYYYLDLINYFTSAGTFDVAPDTIISCGITDAGYGLLTGNDRILLLGTAVEEVPQTAPDTTTIINNGTSSTTLLDLAPITNAIAALQNDIDSIQALLGE